ncbi:hypothetical protein [Hydrogenimonas sp.]
MTKQEATEMKELKREIETLKEDLAKLTQTLQKVAESKVKETAEDLQKQILSQIPEEQLEKLEEAKRKGEEVIETLKEQQEKHPAGTLLVAAGIGFLLGRVLGGKSG